MHYKEPEDRNQLQLFTSLDLFISPDHPIRVIDALIESIFNSNADKFIYKGQNNCGQKAYSPKTFLKLYIYGYLNSITTSRKLEVETKRNIEVKWLLGNLQPDFKTIADYRKDNKDQINFVTKQIRAFLKSNKLMKGDLVAIDGTKVKANARKDMLNKEKIEKRLIKMNNQIEEYLQKLDKNDAQENMYENYFNDDDTSSMNRKLLDKIAKLHNEIEKLKQAQEELKVSDKKYISLTDKDAMLVKSKNSKIPGYNIQAAVDAENMMIMYMYVGDSAVDRKEMQPMAEKIEEEYNETPKIMVGDKGYYNSDMIQEIEKNTNIECITPISKSTRNKGKIEFTYDKEKDIYLCSEGKELKLVRKGIKKRDKILNVYQCFSCNNCSRKEECTTSKKGRMIYCYENQEWRDSFKKKMNNKRSKEIISKRKAIVEHVFGTIKYWMGQIPLKLRGKEKVETEINIYSSAYNIKRLINLNSFTNIIGLINDYAWDKA